MEKIFFEGFLLQGSLIFALGAQNLFVLESGLRRHHHLTVSFVCFLCDFCLIMLGVAGAATLFTHFPEAKVVVGVLGVFFLLSYGVGKLKTNEEQIILNQESHKEKNLKKSIFSAISFSVLNPHAYLDGIVLIGGYSSKYSHLVSRLTLGMGAAICSWTWFLILSTASSRLMPFFQNPKRLRVLMSLSGVMLILLSFKLSMEVYSWMNEGQNSTQVIVSKEK